jgi:hypothetical protein
MRSRLGGVLVAVACASLLGAGCGGAAVLDAKALAEHSKAVQSLAAEGALLAEDSAAGRSTGIYRRSHSAELAVAAAAAQKSLAHAKATPKFESKRRELARIASKVRTDLERLRGASKDEQRALGPALEAAAHESERIGSELG